MIEAERKNNESTGSLLRRFSRQVRRSGVLYEARRNQFFKKDRNKRQRKEAALRRQRLSTLRRRLIKKGRLDPQKKIDLSKIREDI